MAKINIPTEHYISPFDGSTCQLNTETETITDESVNTFPLAILTGTRKLNAARKYLKGFCKGNCE